MHVGLCGWDCRGRLWGLGHRAFPAWGWCFYSHSVLLHCLTKKNELMYIFMYICIYIIVYNKCTRVLYIRRAYNIKMCKYVMNTTNHDVIEVKWAVVPISPILFTLLMVDPPQKSWHSDWWWTYATSCNPQESRPLPRIEICNPFLRTYLDS